MLSLEKQFTQAQFESQVDTVQDVESLQMMLKGVHRLYLICQQSIESLPATDSKVATIFGGRTNG